MTSLQYIDDSNFREMIDTSAVPVLVDFYADWCPPCRRLTPLLETLSEQLDGQLRIVKLDVDNSSLASQFGVMNIPTMILFKNGQEVSRLIGNQSKSRLMKQLTPHIS